MIVVVVVVGRRIGRGGLVSGLGFLGSRPAWLASLTLAVCDVAQEDGCDVLSKRSDRAEMTLGVSVYVVIVSLLPVGGGCTIPCIKNVAGREVVEGDTCRACTRLVRIEQRSCLPARCNM